MNKFIYLCFLLYVSSLSLTGCSSTESDNIKTEGFYVVYSLSESGANVRADVTFYVGGTTGTVIRLSAGDSVTCNGVALGESQDLFGKYYYWGGCGTLATGATHTFVFTRAVEDDDDEVYTSTITMPEAVIISSPADSATLTRGQTIPVTWNAQGAGDSMSVSISGSGQSATEPGTASFSDGSSGLTDNGSHTLLGTQTNPDSITGIISNGSITVTRRRSGFMDPLLDGSIGATRSDTITGLTLNP